MAQVVDRWHKAPVSGMEVCREHSTKTHQLAPSAAHGSGQRWQVRYRDAAGKQRKENFGTKPQAETRAAAVAVDLDKGRSPFPEQKKITFREYAEQWRQVQPHRPNTARDVRQTLDHYVYPTFGERRIASIRPSEIQAWAVGLVKVRGLSEGTARKACQKAAAVFRAAVRDQVIPLSPCIGVKLVRSPHSEIIPLTADQVRLLAKTVPERYHALVILAAGSGLRPGELFGLQVRHIDFLRRTVKVEQQAQRAHPGVVICPPKTDHSYRTVPLPQAVIDALVHHLADHPVSADGFLFGIGDHATDAEHFAQNVWRPAVGAAGLPKGTRLHDLRHTYASVLIAAGKGPKTVAARLGDTVAVAMETYAHLFPEEDEDTRTVVGDFLAQAV